LASADPMSVRSRLAFNSFHTCLDSLPVAER
jgi:hypothetical protein